MKKNLLKSLSLALCALVFFACSNPSKMAKHANLVKTECNPQILEAKAGQISATYSMFFPAKYFAKKAYMEVVPVLVFNGGEAIGETLILQGDKVLDNNTVISHENGGSVTRNVVFDYLPGMEQAVLELRAVAFKSKDAKKFYFPAPYKIADGTNTTYMLVKTNGFPSFENDNYQHIIKETEESQILYLINSPVVRNSQLSSKEIKDYEAFLRKTVEDDRRVIVSNDIVAYASPDGIYDQNAKLAENRAKTAKTAFVNKISKKADIAGTPVNVSDIAEDWEGFKELVEASDIPDKELILRVLSMYSDPNVRSREIKNMSNVFQILAKKILPQLRKARFITNIEYKNWTDAELNQLITENIGKLDEESLLYAATLVNDDATKMRLYNEAGNRFNSSRGWNNLAAVLLQQGKTADAKAALGKMSDKNGSYFNNMGVVAMQEGDLVKSAEAFAKSNVPQAKYNLGTLNILAGNYPQAVTDLNGSNSFNEALSYVLTNNLAKASSILKSCTSPLSYYLQAVIAARQGNASEAKADLAKASQDSALAARAKTDIEFAKL